MSNVIELRPLCPPCEMDEAGGWDELHRKILADEYNDVQIKLCAVHKMRIERAVQVLQSQRRLQRLKRGKTQTQRLEIDQDVQWALTVNRFLLDPHSECR